MGYFYHKKVYTRWTVDMDIFLDTIFPAFGPQEMLYFGVSKPMLFKKIAQTRNQERNWQTGMGSLKVHQKLPTFEFSLSNTSCSTSMWNFGFIAGMGCIRGT